MVQNHLRFSCLFGFLALQADPGIAGENKPEKATIGVSIPAPLNKGSVVGYAKGVLKSGRNQSAAMHYVGYLHTDAAQGIYAKYGSVNATREETGLK